MKKIIFFALALMALVGAGVGGFILFGKKPDEAAHAEAPPPKPKGPPAFLTVGPVILPVVGETRVEQTVLIMVSLEMADDGTREQVRTYMPRLNDAYIRALYGQIGRSDIVEGQLVDINAVKAKLTKATHEVLDPLGFADAIQDVLIQNVTQRPAF
jgi:flagellar protein FliL